MNRAIVIIVSIMVFSVMMAARADATNSMIRATFAAIGFAALSTNCHPPVRNENGDGSPWASQSLQMSDPVEILRSECDEMRFARVFVPIVLLFVSTNGCQEQVPSKMIVSGDFPADRSELHPWIAGMLDKDTDSVAREIRERIAANASPELARLIDYVDGFVPQRLVYVNKTGFVVCLRRSALGQTMFHSNDFLVFAPPLPAEEIEERVRYFDDEIRPIMREFMSKFAGFGEQIEEQHAGQFPLRSFSSAKTIAYHEPEKLGEWKDARVLYHCATGDLLLINHCGETAWHEFTKNEIVPLFNSFKLTMKHFVELHQYSQEASLDSWSSRDFLRGVQQ